MSHRRRRFAYRPRFIFSLRALILSALPILALSVAAAAPIHSASDALYRFTEPTVPAKGAGEVPVDPPRGKSFPEMAAQSYPGHGLSEHPMVYIGEGCSTIFIVNQGKIIWTYDTGKGWELDDIWLLSNGNILFSRMSYAEEVTPNKKVIWHRDAKPGTEIHTLQPVGLDRVMLVENGLPPRLLMLNLKTNQIESEHALPAISPTDRRTVHGQFRRVRLTASGTYLVSFLEMDRVVEYDHDFKEIWSYSIPSPWAAIRLHNGNTLITDEKDALTREVSHSGETVWEIKLSELPASLHFTQSQSCVRLNNGNTILCSRGDAGAGCQLVEVNQAKKVVWALYDWKNFGPATAVQILDEAGVPEIPGALQR